MHLEMILMHQKLKHFKLTIHLKHLTSTEEMNSKASDRPDVGFSYWSWPLLDPHEAELSMTIQTKPFHSETTRDNSPKHDNSVIYSHVIPNLCDLHCRHIIQADIPVIYFFYSRQFFSIPNQININKHYSICI